MGEELVYRLRRFFGTRRRVVVTLIGEKRRNSPNFN